MDIFHMMDIIPLLNIPQPPKGRSSYYIPCPCCDSGKKKGCRDGHLNINLIKDVFRCPRCNFSGGVFDLYSYFADVPRDKVRDILIEKLNGKSGSIKKSGRSDIKLPSPPEINEYAPIDIISRDATYTAFLQMLSLAADHRENLMNRGLSEQAIELNGYKTAPMIGMKTMAKKLQSEGYYLSGVPGFFKKEGEWTFKAAQRGILVPVRDVEGRIQGLQLRLDNVSKRKFRWISSAGEQDGCAAEGWTHFTGQEKKSLILTEGPMKADVIHHLTGSSVLAVPGVNTLTHLEASLILLKEQGLERIMTAFDMDFLKNPHVQSGYNNLIWLLDKLGIKFGTYIWHSDYKGLDDYIWEYCQNRNHDDIHRNR